MWPFKEKLEATLDKNCSESSFKILGEILRKSKANELGEDSIILGSVDLIAKTYRIWGEKINVSSELWEGLVIYGEKNVVLRIQEEFLRLKEAETDP